MKSINLLIAALFALTSTSAFAEGDGQHGGQGEGKTDRSNSHLPVICRANETAVAVQGADGKIIWTCTTAAGSAS